MNSSQVRPQGFKKDITLYETMRYSTTNRLETLASSHLFYETRPHTGKNHTILILLELSPHLALPRLGSLFQ